MSLSKAKPKPKQNPADQRPLRAVHLLVWALVAIVFVLALNGCGWRLRGAANLELALPPVHLQFQNASEVLQRDLRQALKANDVQLVEKADEAGVRVVIRRDSSGRRVLSVGRSGKVSEYELQYQLSFAFYDKANELLVEDVITQQRDYAFDEDEVLAKQEEERLLFDFMRHTAVQSLLRRLQSTVKNLQKSPAPQPQLDKPETPKPETPEPEVPKPEVGDAG